jgi:hypothetical protein
MADKSFKIARDYLSFLKNAFFSMDEDVILSFWSYVGEGRTPKTIPEMFARFDS